VPQTSRVIVLQPVLETRWAAAVMRIADCNTVEPWNGARPPRPTDALGTFLHGLLTMDGLFASGGLRITDTASGTTLLPGCRNGTDERRDRLEVVADLRQLLAGAERDPTDFLQLATAWAALHLPEYAAPVVLALGRALDLPAPVIPPNPQAVRPEGHRRALRPPRPRSVRVSSVQRWRLTGGGPGRTGLPAVGRGS